MKPLVFTDDIIAKFHVDMLAKADCRREFFNSDLFKRMAADIIACEPICCEEVLYTFERVQQTYGWEDLTKQQVQEFVEVASDSTDSDAFIDCPDDDNPFDHSYHLKGGLMVFVMHGQGTVCTILAPAHDPEMYEKLLAIKEQ